jgi:cytochrome P450
MQLAPTTTGIAANLVAKRHRAAPAIPVAPGLPFIGNAVDLFQRPLEFFVQSYHELGPIFRASGPGRDYVIMAGPEANAFLLDGGEDYLDNKPIYQGVARQLKAQNYPIATDGARHQHIRRTLKPAFNHAAFTGYVSRMIEAAAAGVGSWQEGERLGALAAMHRLVGDQMGGAIVDAPLGERLKDAVTFARFSVGAGLGAYPDFLAHAPHYRLAKRRMNAFFRQIVAEHRARPRDEASGDMVDLLLAATDSEGQPLPDEDVIANMQMVYSNSLLYGAPMCAFLLYALLKHPKALRRVRAEVDAVFADGTPDVRTLQQAPELRGAMLESMRVLPIALATPRLVAKPFSFGGYEVQPGQTVLVAVSVCHFLPQFFPKPYTFDIDRYRAPRNEHHQPGALVPFGLGAHACLGRGLVELFVMTTLAAILRQVELELDPGDYTLRRVVNPFPEPEAAFAVRVVGRRRNMPR